MDRAELFGTKKAGHWVWITYAEFGALVENFRGGLASLGVERGDRIAIVSNNRVAWAVAAYAGYGLGAALVPMYEAQSPKDWEFVVRDCAAKLLLVPNESVLAKAIPMLEAVPTLKHIVLLEGAPHGDPRVSTYTSLLASGRAAPSNRPAPDDLAALLYTSGTTGVPKGVVLSHGNLASNVSASRRFSPVDQPIVRSRSCPGPMPSAKRRTCTCFSPPAPRSPSAKASTEILDNLAEVRPTVIACVPTIFNRVYTAVQRRLAHRPKPVQRLVLQALRVKAKERAGGVARLDERLLVTLVDKDCVDKVRARLGGRLRYAISGGAALSRDVAEFIDSLGIVVFVGYGLTETSPVATANRPDALKLGSVGKPVPGVRISIHPDSGEHHSAGPRRRLARRRRDRGLRSERDEGVLPTPGGDRCRLHPRRRLSHRRHGLPRCGGVSLHHGENQRAVNSRTESTSYRLRLKMRSTEPVHRQCDGLRGQQALQRRPGRRERPVSSEMGHGRPHCPPGESRRAFEERPGPRAIRQRNRSPILGVKGFERIQDFRPRLGRLFRRERDDRAENGP